MTTRRASRRASAIVKSIVGVAIVGGAIVGGYVTLRPDAGNADADIALYTVSTGDFDISLVASGELQAKTSTIVRSKLESESTVVSLVEEGAYVEQGDLLIELSSDDIRDRLENEMLSLESARSDLVGAKNSFEIQLSDNESRLRAAQVRLQLAKLEKNKWVDGTDVEKKRQLELDVKANGDELERLEEKLERSEKLYKENFLSGDQLKQDRLALTRARAELEKAKLRQDVYLQYEREMELTKLENEISESTAELARVERKNESEIASRQANVTNAERTLAVREQRVKKLEEELASTRITAPTSGLVVYATSLDRGWRGNDEALDVGSQIYPNEEIIMLPNSSEMIAAIKVHESHVGEIEEGQHASVRIDALRGRVIEGVVDSVGVVAESGGWRDPNLREYTVNVLLDIDNPQELGVKPSMRCEATLYVDRVENTLHVPVPAVFFEDHSTVVYTPHPSGKYERRIVQLGRRSDQEVEVVAGLDEGERVLLRQPSPGEIYAADELDPEPGTQADAR